MQNSCPPSVLGEVFPKPGHTGSRAQESFQIKKKIKTKKKPVRVSTHRWLWWWFLRKKRRSPDPTGWQRWCCCWDQPLLRWPPPLPGKRPLRPVQSQPTWIETIKGDWMCSGVFCPSAACRWIARVGNAAVHQARAPCPRVSGGGNTTSAQLLTSSCSSVLSHCQRS